LHVSGGYVSIAITAAKTRSKIIGGKNERLCWAFIAKSKLLLWTYGISSQVVKEKKEQSRE